MQRQLEIKERKHKDRELVKKEKLYIKMLKDLVPHDSAGMNKLVKHLTGKQLTMLTQFINQADDVAVSKDRMHKNRYHDQ